MPVADLEWAIERGGVAWCLLFRIAAAYEKSHAMRWRAGLAAGRGSLNGPALEIHDLFNVAMGACVAPKCRRSLWRNRLARYRICACAGVLNLCVAVLSVLFTKHDRMPGFGGIQPLERRWAVNAFTGMRRTNFETPVARLRHVSTIRSAYCRIRGKIEVEFAEVVRRTLSSLHFPACRKPP